MSNNIFCTAPFTTLRIESYSPASPERWANLGVVFKPGCVYDPDGAIPSLEEYLYGTEMETHRDNLCNGTQPKANCHKCSRVEQQGLSSVRMHLLRKQWASDEKKIKMLDIFFGNICNLGCVMCNEDTSSFAANERFQAGIIPLQIRSKNNIDIAIESMDQLPDLESVSFIGGEFFMVRENVKIIEKIIERDLTCTVHTNATLIDEYLLQHLDRVKNLEFRMSIDGIDDVYEIIRYPAAWYQFANNVDFFSRRLPNAQKFFSMVVQPLNIQNLHETFDWTNRRKIFTHYQIIETPRYLAWDILTDQEKNNMRNLLIEKNQRSFGLTQQQKTMIDNLAHSITGFGFCPDTRKQGVQFLGRLLSYRKIDQAKVRRALGQLEDLSDEIVSAMSQKS